MYTTKNPKTNNSFFNFNLVLVKHCGEEIGHIVQYERTTCNRYGGRNYWEVIQFIPLKGMNNYSLETKHSPLYKDLSSYEDMQVNQWFHMGARDGVEEQLFFIKDFEPIKVTLKNVTKSASSWQKVIGKIVLYWNGEQQEVVNDNIVINDNFILFKEDSGACYVTRDSIKSSYISRDIIERSFVLTKNEIINMVSTAEEEESLEAPEDDDLITEDAHPKRMRRRVI